MDGLDLSALDKIGVVGFCVLVFVALMRDWLVTGPSHRREVEDLREQIRNLRRVVEVKDAQLDRLSEVGRTVEAVLRSIKEMAERRSP